MDIGFQICVPVSLDKPFKSLAFNLDHTALVLTQILEPNGALGINDGFDVITVAPKTHHDAAMGSRYMPMLTIAPAFH